MDSKEFEEMTGLEPQQDDLERANCNNTGEIGHQQCGICEEHDNPRFICGCIAPLKKDDE